MDRNTQAMSIPFEFVVDGPIVSQQTRRSQRREAWINKVRSSADAAWSSAQPQSGAVSVTLTCFFHGRGLDVDNIPKPILDAMNGLVYTDDEQVRDLRCRKRDLDADLIIRSALTSSSRLDEIAQAIEDQPDWSFELVLVAEPDRLESPVGAKPFDSGALSSRVEQAQLMLEAGQTEPAFLLAWSACEAALRLLAAEQEATANEIASTRQMLGQAASLGNVSDEEHRELLQLQRRRNALVHGLEDPDFSEDQARRLLEIVRGVIATLA